MALTPSFWKNRSVLLTGHTGFIGSWTALWLSMLGARVTGVSLPPSTQPNHYSLLRLSGLSHHETDICDAKALAGIVAYSKPSVVLHLAAQPIVARAHQDPIETWRVNALGTVTLLQALRDASSVESVIVFTTDKVYANDETGRAFKETDPLGGHGLYDSSKSATELAAQSFAHTALTQCGVATVRAGNVIGGGDWGEARLVPDAMRAFSAGQTLELRSPQSVRPWQHVLEVVAATLQLAEKLQAEHMRFAGAWNIGPAPEAAVTTESLAQQLAASWGGGAHSKKSPSASDVPEAKLLHLDSGKIRKALHWQPVLNWEDTLRLTVAWYKAYYRGDAMQSVSEADIRAFSERMV